MRDTMNTKINVGIAAILTTLAVSAVSAGPLKVRTSGAKSQEVVMCPDCHEKLACAKAGDYTIGFDADLENPKTGAARVAVHVKDLAGNPVEHAKVVASLSMPKHRHGKRPFALKHVGHGRYEAGTNLVMTGGWTADVAVTPPSGDTVKQKFSFSR
jgi:hypothetical protein